MSYPPLKRLDDFAAMYEGLEAAVLARLRAMPYADRINAGAQALAASGTNCRSSKFRVAAIVLEAIDRIDKENARKKRSAPLFEEKKP